MFVGVRRVVFEIQDGRPLLLDEVKDFSAGGASGICFVSSPPAR